MEEAPTFSQFIHTTFDRLNDILDNEQSQSSDLSRTSLSPVLGIVGNTPPPSAQPPVTEDQSFDSLKSNIEVILDSEYTSGTPTDVSPSLSPPLSNIPSLEELPQLPELPELLEIPDIEGELQKDQGRSSRRSPRERVATQEVMELRSSQPKRLGTRKRVKGTTTTRLRRSTRSIQRARAPLKERSVNELPRVKIKLSKLAPPPALPTPPSTASRPQNKRKAPRARSPELDLPPQSTQGQEADVESAGEGPSAPPRKMRHKPSNRTSAKRRGSTLSRPQKQINEATASEPELLTTKLVDVVFSCRNESTI